VETFYFGHSCRRLFGILDAPDDAHTGIVFCPPFGDEMASTYAALAVWGKQLAKLGFAVLRFHPYGTGESEGTFAEFTVQGALSDISTAVRHLRERVGAERVGLLGTRFGGFLAAQSVLSEPAAFLILWSPIIDSRQYFRNLLRMQLAADLIHMQVGRVRTSTQSMVQDFQAGRSVDVLGSEFSPQLYLDMTEGPGWPQQFPQVGVLWLSRLAEGAQAEAPVHAWKDSGCDVDLNLLPEAPFWEQLSRIFPEKFSAASEKWLMSRQRSAKPR
jgi:exosortase A-associated hydrolase 2